MIIILQVKYFIYLFFGFYNYSLNIISKWDCHYINVDMWNLIIYIVFYLINYNSWYWSSLIKIIIKGLFPYYFSCKYIWPTFKLKFKSSYYCLILYSNLSILSFVFGDFLWNQFFLIIKSILLLYNNLLL